MNESSSPTGSLASGESKDWSWLVLAAAGVGFSLARLAVDEISRPIRGVPIAEFIVWYAAGGFAVLLFPAVVVLPLAFFARRSENRRFRVRKAIIVSGAILLAFTELMSFGK